MQLFVNMEDVLADFDRHHETVVGYGTDKLLDNANWVALEAYRNVLRDHASDGGHAAPMGAGLSDIPVELSGVPHVQGPAAQKVACKGSFIWRLFARRNHNCTSDWPGGRVRCRCRLPVPLTLRSIRLGTPHLLGATACIANLPCGPTVPLTLRPVAVVYRACPFVMWSGPARRLGHGAVCPLRVV
jgi:hypothetical protein